MNKSELRKQKRAWSLRETKNQPEKALLILQQLSLTAAALSNWSDVFDISIDETICWNNLGKRDHKQIYFTKALDKLKFAEKLIDKYKLEKPQIYYYYAEVYFATEQFKNALKHYERYLQLAKLSQSATGNINRHIAEALFNLHQTDQANILFHRSLKQIRTYDENHPSLAYVWESGALVALAKIQVNPQTKYKYLNEAKEIAIKHNLGGRLEEISKLIKETDLSSKM